MSRSCSLVAFIVTLALVPAGAAAQDARDDFHHLGQINKASIVMLTEAGLVPEPLGATIAAGIAQVVAEQDEPGLPPLVRLPRLRGAAGGGGRPRRVPGCTPEGAGRTSARRSGGWRCGRRCSPPTERCSLPATRSSHWRRSTPARSFRLHARGAGAADLPRPLPAGVLRRPRTRREPPRGSLRAAQPEPARRGGPGHLGLPHRPQPTGGAARLRRRPGELLRRQPRVVGGLPRRSSPRPWPSRQSPPGSSARTCRSSYHDPAPWLLLDRSLTGISSIMPQKRNPIALERLRQIASTVLGDAQTVSSPRTTRRPA